MGITNYGADDELKRRLADLERRMKVMEVTPQINNVHVEYPVYQTAGNVGVNSGTYVQPYAAYIEEVETDSVLIRVPWSADAATTGDFRVRNVATSTTTSAVSITAAGSGQQVFRWLHGSAIGATGVQLVFEFRRLTGAGFVYSLAPPGIAMIDQGTGTATGL